VRSAGDRRESSGGIVVRTFLRIAAAALVLVVGLGFALLATDVVLLHRGLGSGDTRFASGSLAGNLWKPRQLVPLGAAQRLLGTEDDLAYRQAVRAFVLGRPRDEPFQSPDLLGQRGHAQDLLQAIVDGDGNVQRRSDAANLIGVLGFANAAIDPEQAYGYLSEAIGRFRQAVSLDPANDDAKYNLELALTRIEHTPRPNGRQQQRDSRGGTGGGAGTGDAGSGY
jgi:hypothetical protein